VAVAYAAFRNDAVRENLHLGAPAFKHGHLKATIVVEVDMQGRLREAMVRVEILGQAFGQLAGRVVIDIAQGRDAMAVLRHFEI
jgi:hypothetical protein